MDEGMDDRRVELALLGITAERSKDLPNPEFVRSHKSEDLQYWWKFRSSLAADETWCVAIERLINSLGGADTLLAMLDDINPEIRRLVIYAPFNSPYQENNGIAANTIKHISTLGLELDVIPVDFDPQNPTHFSLL